MYNIIICDDDHNYVEYLEKKIRTLSSYSQEFIIRKCYSGEEFLNIQEQRFDLIFLDMQMGKVNGITAALNYRQYDQEAIIIFCTGLQRPKPEFFDVQPFRYLMKSYSESKMEYEIGIILSKMMENKIEKSFIVTQNGQMQKIRIRDIMYISNLKRGACIHCYSRETKCNYETTTNKKLSEVYSELKGQHFEYAHNSYIVNFESIIGINNDVMTLLDLITLNISRSRKTLFHSRFAEFLGKKYKRHRM